MRLDAPLVGMLTNLEVMRVLHERGASSGSPSTSIATPGARALPSENAVFQYLASTQAGLRDDSALCEFTALMKAFGLFKLEVLNIMNLCPTTPVEMFLLVDDCDERLSEQQVEEILRLVSSCLQH